MVMIFLSVVNSCHLLMDDWVYMKQMYSEIRDRLVNFPIVGLDSLKLSDMMIWNPIRKWILNIHKSNKLKQCLTHTHPPAKFDITTRNMCLCLVKNYLTKVLIHARWHQRLAFVSENILSRGDLDEPQKAEIVSKSKLVPSVFVKTHYWINHR